MATDRQPIRHKDLLRLLAERGGCSIAEMAAHFHVTQTAIRQRLVPPMHTQSVARRYKGERRRGRPRFIYQIASRGETTLASAAAEGLADETQGRV